jgi:ADP-ribose pyrophosphatase YjhB (NUDIX family)
VVVSHVGGSKSSAIKLVLEREPNSRKIWFPTGLILPNEEHVDTTVRKLFEEASLSLTVVDLTLLSTNLVRVPLPTGKHRLV